MINVRIRTRLKINSQIYPLCLQEFPLASPWGNPSGKGVYLTVHPSSRPNTDTIQFSLVLYTTVIGSRLHARSVQLGRGTVSPKQDITYIHRIYDHQKQLKYISTQKHEIRALDDQSSPKYQTMSTYSNTTSLVIPGLGYLLSCLNRLEISYRTAIGLSYLLNSWHSSTRNTAHGLRKTSLKGERSPLQRAVDSASSIKLPGASCKKSSVP